MPHGSDDVQRAASELAAQLPEPLAPLARVAYNYAWSWARGGHETFRSIDPARYDRVGGNPVRVLTEADAGAIHRAASDSRFLDRMHALVHTLDGDLARPFADALDPQHPVAFMCAEFG